MQDSSNILDNMRRSNSYMKRFFWLLLVATILQIVENIRVLNANNIPWQNLLLTILFSIAITALLLFFLFKTVHANTDFLERNSTGNLVRAIQHETSFFKVLKIATWIGLIVIIALMCFTLLMGYRTYFM